MSNSQKQSGQRGPANKGSSLSPEGEAANQVVNQLVVTANGVDQELTDAEQAVVKARADLKAAGDRYAFVAAKLQKLASVTQQVNAIAAERPHDAALLAALKRCTSFPRVNYQRNGADDRKILLALATGWPKTPRKVDGTEWHYAGGQFASFVRQGCEAGDAERLSLAAEVRRLLAIPQPKDGTPRAAKAEKRATVSKSPPTEKAKTAVPSPKASKPATPKAKASTKPARASAAPAQAPTPPPVAAPDPTIERLPIPMPAELGSATILLKQHEGRWYFGWEVSCILGSGNRAIEPDNDHSYSEAVQAVSAGIERLEREVSQSLRKADGPEGRRFFDAIRAARANWAVHATFAAAPADASIPSDSAAPTSPPLALVSVPAVPKGASKRKAKAGVVGLPPVAEGEAGGVVAAGAA